MFFFVEAGVLEHNTVGCILKCSSYFCHVEVSINNASAFLLSQ